MPDRSWKPTAADVAQLLPQRTKGEYGKDGEFTTETTPTLAQVEGLCAKAANEVATDLRLTGEKEICPEGPVELAKDTAALRAAMLVELTYFANQLRTDGSPFKELKGLFNEKLERLEKAYEDECVGAGGLGGLEAPRGRFPRGRPWQRVRF